MTPHQVQAQWDLIVRSSHGAEYDLIYERLPKDIADRYVLLMDPILGTGNSAARCISVLHTDALSVLSRESRF